MVSVVIYAMKLRQESKVSVATIYGSVVFTRTKERAMASKVQKIDPQPI